MGAFVLLGSRLLWVPPHHWCASAFLSWLLWDSLCFVKDPASLGPSSIIVRFTFPASLGERFVLLGSRLLWIPPQPLCVCTYLSWLFCDSFCFVRFSASLVPSPLLCSFVLYCPDFSGTVFRGPWLILVPSPLFSRCMVWVILMHRLTAWPWYHSLNASQEHLLLMPPGSFESFCSVRIPASLAPSPSLVCFCFSVLASLGQFLFF